METIFISNGQKTVEVVRQVFNAYPNIFEGFEQVDTPQVVSPAPENNQPEPEKAIQDYTKAEIVSLLKQEDIKFNPQDNKASLIELYESTRSN